MARDFETIKKEIEDKVHAKTGLNAVSHTAEYKLWMDIVADCLAVFENLQAKFYQELLQEMQKYSAFTASWYAKKVLDFQLNYDLQANDRNEWGYPVVDEAAKIVKRVAVSDDNAGVLTIKVAKLKDNQIVALDKIELNALKHYLDRIKSVGTKIQLVSLNADSLQVNMQVFVSALVDKVAIKQQVEEAVAQYCGSLNFDAVLVKNQLLEQLRAITGIVDVDFYNLTAWQGTDSIAIERKYICKAGYIVYNLTSAEINPSTIEIYEETYGH